MKPMGLEDPRTGRRPYAVVQLRQENLRADSYNLVGFQNHMRFPEQARVFRMIPGLERAEFLRYGQIHRNTYINAPALLTNTLQLRKNPRVFFAGQISGVEGYVESIATGLIAGRHARNWPRERRYERFLARRPSDRCAHMFRARTRAIISRRTSRLTCCRRWMNRRACGFGTTKRLGTPKFAGAQLRSWINICLFMPDSRTSELAGQIERFLDELRRQNASEHTVRNYASDLEQLLDYFRFQESRNRRWKTSTRWRSGNGWDIYTSSG
jgi:hypothetical protein